MDSFFKVVDRDGLDPYKPKRRWLPEEGESLPEGGLIVRADLADLETSPTACAGEGLWPCRLARVEPVDTGTWRVVEELDGFAVFGPQGQQVDELLNQACYLDPRACADLRARQDSLGGRAWTQAYNRACAVSEQFGRDAASLAAEDQVRDDISSYWSSARSFACGTVRALVVRDLLDPADYDALTTDWRIAVGPIHPDDPELEEPAPEPMPDPVETVKAVLHSLVCDGTEQGNCERALESLRPALAQVWDEGHRTLWQREPDMCQCYAFSAGECGCGLYGTGALVTPNPYRDQS